MVVRGRRLTKLGVAAKVYVPCREGLVCLQNRGRPCGEGSQAPGQPRLFSELWKTLVAVFLVASRGVCIVLQPVVDAPGGSGSLLLRMNA